MFKRSLPLLAAVVLHLVLTSAAGAQEWRPPSREMPTMPEVSELTGNWMAGRAEWFSGIRTVSGIDPSELRPAAEGRRGSRQAQIVRFNSGPVPVVVWQDRNGDGRADLIEIYRGAGVIIQLVDATYNGQADVIRIYSPDGSLSREERL
jgi:hypothetical protein